MRRSQARCKSHDVRITLRTCMKRLRASGAEDVALRIPRGACCAVFQGGMQTPVDDISIPIRCDRIDMFYHRFYATFPSYSYYIHSRAFENRVCKWFSSLSLIVAQSLGLNVQCRERACATFLAQSTGVDAQDRSDYLQWNCQQRIQQSNRTFHTFANGLSVDGKMSISGRTLSHSPNFKYPRSRFAPTASRSSGSISPGMAAGLGRFSRP